jgi:uncharacterized spore protein YtfJ
VGEEVKTSKEIVGKPIHIGERTLIPVIELSSYSRRIGEEHNSGGLVMTGVTVTPIYVKVIEGEQEWILRLQENRTPGDTDETNATKAKPTHFN